MSKRRRRTLKQQDFLFDRVRVRELSKLARLRHPDGHGDYILPDTPAGRYLAIAIITHFQRRPGKRGEWLFQFCRERAPWLDPDEIDVTQLRPCKAEKLGARLQLTAAERTAPGIVSIAPCDQTAEQRATQRKERRRQRERDRRRQKREAKGGMTRAQWEANSKSRGRPWELEGVSRATWYRRRGKPAPVASAALCKDAAPNAETGTVPCKELLLVGTQPVSRGNGTAEKGVGEQGATGTLVDVLSALWGASRPGAPASRLH